MSIFTKAWGGIKKAANTVGKGVTTAANAVASAAVYTVKTANGVVEGLMDKRAEEIKNQFPFLKGTKEEKKDQIKKV